MKEQEKSPFILPKIFKKGLYLGTLILRLSLCPGDDLLAGAAATGLLTRFLPIEIASNFEEATRIADAEFGPKEAVTPLYKEIIIPFEIEL